MENTPSTTKFCKDCIYLTRTFKCTENNSLLDIDPVQGTRIYTSAYTLRMMDSKCGPGAKYFSPTIFYKLFKS